MSLSCSLLHGFFPLSLTSLWNSVLQPLVLGKSKTNGERQHLPRVTALCGVPPKQVVLADRAALGRAQLFWSC